MTPSQKSQVGGAAFPLHPGIAPDWTASTGMTLRDFFAALIMAGFAADPTSHELFDDMPDAARCAYEGADAMLAAREAQP
ncbi:hypothetical protein A6J80_17190 [Paracoccus yeei]|uniref:Uncharacterized protein n=1 Tax=Paracoccus yeei TaxID=147645 RepID=A0A1V0GVK8_9RHOB|nr:hypothetical protein [Paracoccus yeei]ARC37851.1 hypothetical protein A6J80_17190 [Paracoccus yeei]